MVEIIMDKVIRAILKSHNTPAIIKNRQRQLQVLVDLHGLANVALATELKESSLKQYLREKKPRITAGLLAQANAVFLSEEYIAARKAHDSIA